MGKDARAGWWFSVVWSCVEVLEDLRNGVKLTNHDCECAVHVSELIVSVTCGRSKVIRRRSSIPDTASQSTSAPSVTITKAAVFPLRCFLTSRHLDEA